MSNIQKHLWYLIISGLFSLALVVSMLHFEPMGIVSIASMYVLSIIILNGLGGWALRKTKNGLASGAAKWIADVCDVSLGFKLILVFAVTAGLALWLDR